MLEALSLVCDPCSGHIAPRSIYVDDGSHGGHGLDVFGVGVALLILMESTHLEGPWMALLMPLDWMLEPLMILEMIGRWSLCRRWSPLL